MSKNIDQLVLTLSKETEIYRDILQIATKKRDFIKDQKMEALEKLVHEEQGLVVALFKLEEIREKAVDLVMRELKVDFVENVTQLSQFMLPADREKVLLAKDNLLIAVKNASDENRFNQKMLEDRLEIIQMNIDLLTQMSGDSGRYNKEASEDAKERRNIFDVRV